MVARSAHAGCRADARDQSSPCGLAADRLTGQRLSHLNLDVVGINKMFRRHAKHLPVTTCNPRTHRIAIRQSFVACRLFAALAGRSAEAIHRVASVVCAGDQPRTLPCKAFHNFRNRLNVLKRDRRGRRNFEQRRFLVCASGRSPDVRFEQIKLALRTACCSVPMVSASIRALRHAGTRGHRHRGPVDRAAHHRMQARAGVRSSATSESAPSTFVAVPVKYASINSLEGPTASKIAL